MWPKALFSVLTALLILAVCVPAVAWDGRVPNVVDPDEHPWGGDGYNGGGGGNDGHVPVGVLPSINNSTFFSRLALQQAWRTVSQYLVRSVTDVAAPHDAVIPAAIRPSAVTDTRRTARY